MSASPELRRQIADAARVLEDALAQHPQCDARLQEPCIRQNKLRPYPGITITPGFAEAPEALKALNNRAPASLSPEERVLQGLLGAPLSIASLNPAAPVLYLGRGPGTLAASFGVPLSAELGYTPYGSRDLEEVLSEGMPDVETSGIIPEMRRHIEAIRELTPSWVQIAPPDTQGPFNIAHMVLGTEALVAPLVEPELFHQFMTVITDFYIAFYQALRGWIGEERYTAFANARCRLRECSVNLISEAMYLEHVLPHDLRICEFFGQVCVHPCSGRHVFQATLRNLPHIVYHEAMPFANAVAPNITAEEAIEAVGDAPIQLAISRELALAEAEQVILADLTINRQHPAFSFFYHIHDAQPRDREALLALHREADRVWREMIAGC